MFVLFKNKKMILIHSYGISTYRIPAIDIKKYNHFVVDDVIFGTSEKKKNVYYMKKKNNLCTETSCVEGRVYKSPVLKFFKYDVYAFIF